MYSHPTFLFGRRILQHLLFDLQFVGPPTLESLSHNIIQKDGVPHRLGKLKMIGVELLFAGIGMFYKSSLSR